MKNIVGTFYRPSKFHSLFNEKGGNLAVSTKLDVVSVK